MTQFPKNDATEQFRQRVLLCYCFIKNIDNFLMSRNI